jgi:hypothetical protein
MDNYSLKMTFIESQSILNFTVTLLGLRPYSHNKKKNIFEKSPLLTIYSFLFAVLYQFVLVFIAFKSVIFKFSDTILRDTSNVNEISQ